MAGKRMESLNFQATHPKSIGSDVWVTPHGHGDGATPMFRSRSCTACHARGVLFSPDAVVSTLHLCTHHHGDYVCDSSSYLRQKQLYQGECKVADRLELNLNARGREWEAFLSPKGVDQDSQRVAATCSVVANLSGFPSVTSASGGDVVRPDGVSVQDPRLLSSLAHEPETTDRRLGWTLYGQ
ncbi:hypothetical protein RRG08_012662 [Elysia crispata]|uniref:Uncharacterized protein n=1 Tax=Elysia crispata TaxID=231223 RepID=A0AAE0YNR2_9GAST|nr:hypothetical protein RRG08_012662 [Elysia crispata]